MPLQSLRKRQQTASWVFPPVWETKQQKSVVNTEGGKKKLDFLQGREPGNTVKSTKFWLSLTTH